MTEPLQIAVADDEPKMLQYFREILTPPEYEVVSTAENGRDLVSNCRKHRPDLIITDIKMPEIDGLEAVVKINRSAPVPVVLVSAHNDPSFVKRALSSQVLAFLIKPIKKADLETAIALAMQRFKEFQALQNQAASLQQALEDRKLIERAKGILMRRACLDEMDAFRRLRKMASDANQKLVEVARMIVTADEAFRPAK